MSGIVPPDHAPNGAVAGRLQGSGSVSADGAATYSIPLWMPPGRAGMAPTLTLDYNSRRGNGLLGVGWMLTGFSQITRCCRTFIQDGDPHEITFDSSDRFALDGQRLVMIESQSGNQEYGDNGAEYRTEQDIHAKIVSIDSDEYGPELLSFIRKMVVF